MRQWIKFYTEALHDRKMRRLPRFDKSVYYDLLLLAGQEDAFGYLPSIDDIAFELDLKIAEAKKSIDKLIQIGIISKDDNGDLFVTKFESRQDSSSNGYERVKRYRNKKKNVDDNANDNGHDNTDDNTDDNGHDNAHDNAHDNVINSNAMITIEEDIEKNKNKNRKEKELEEEEELNNYVGAYAPTTKTQTQKTEIQKNSEKRKLKPDDDDFWKVFGAEKQRAQAFYKATGIYPVNKSEFGRWQKDLPQFSEVNIPIEAMIKAVEKIQSEQKITIASPGSVFTTARNIANQRTVSHSDQGKMDIWDRAEAEIEAEFSKNPDKNAMDVFGMLGYKSTSEDVIDL